MKLGVIGGGIVGRAMARCFMEHAEIRVYDVMLARATHSLVDTLNTDLVFVCLPTPQKNGSFACDTSCLDDFFSFRLGEADIEHWARQRNFVIRSTVPIGYTEQARRMHNIPNIVHSPEFLTSRCAITDAQIPARNIIGGLDDYDNVRCPMLVDLYEKRFPGVPIHIMTDQESEAVKLFLNGFFAVKLAYFNEIRELSDKLRIRWNKVLEGILSDGRIAHSHTKVPGADGFGFAGACLPKDLANLIACQGAANLQSHVAYAAHARNQADRKRS